MAFAENRITVSEEVDARKTQYMGDGAYDLVASAKKIYVASGKKILVLDPKTEDKDELLKKITGRTGNLRAPTLKIDDNFYVGYNVDMYEGLIED